MALPDDADVADTPEVRDEREGGRFVLEADGELAELIYRTVRGRLILIHTEVPEALGGRGLGGVLVRAALQRARTEGLIVIPWCPFARRWLTDHPEAAEGVDIDWTTLPPGQSEPPGQGEP